jgi:predicted secreted hydrolase
MVGSRQAPAVVQIGARVRRRGTRSLGFAAVILAVLCAATSACSAATPAATGGAAPLAATGQADVATAGTGTAGGCSKSVSLPKDEAPHSGPVEWWYFDGHLSGKDATGHVHTYGYEYVTFQVTAFGPAPVYLGNLSLTDLTRKTFQSAGKQDSYPIPKTTGRFALHAGNWTMSGGSGRDTLQASTSAASLDLALRTTEPAVLEGNKCGYIPMGPLGSSYYYSWTSLATAGTIVDHGVTLKVTGTSWMDHQWGPLTLLTGGGWDWFSMQLSNGQQYMLYFIKNKNGQIVETAGTRVAGSGKNIKYLTAADIGEKATGSWTSPATHIKYGSGWKVTVPGGELTVTPDLRDQEVDLTAQHITYWEGDVTVSGKIGGATVSGAGYTELTPDTGRS